MCIFLARKKEKGKDKITIKVESVEEKLLF
jgi:hypothetical protein